MIVVSVVSYRYNINGSYSIVLQARMGIRQGDPFLPLLFVIIMEYLNMLLFKM